MRVPVDAKPDEIRMRVAAADLCYNEANKGGGLWAGN